MNVLKINSTPKLIVLSVCVLQVVFLVCMYNTVLHRYHKSHNGILKSLDVSTVNSHPPPTAAVVNQPVNQVVINNAPMHKVPLASSYGQQQNMMHNGTLASVIKFDHQMTIATKKPAHSNGLVNIPYTRLKEVKAASKKEVHQTTDEHNVTHINMILVHREKQFVIRFKNNLMNADIIQHNAEFCASAPNLMYIIYIYTAPQNFVRRNFLRQTWASNTFWNNGKSRTIFLVGRTSSAELQNIINKELQFFGDIVQGDFIDSYHNLTLKGLLALKWITKYCTNAEFVIKADDDVVPNMFEIYRVIENQIVSSQDHEHVLCVLNTHAVVTRGGKWSVPAQQLTGLKVYPPICLGGLYGFSMKVANKMLPIAIKTPYFHLEDVLFTGFIIPQIDDMEIYYVDISKKWVLISSDRDTVLINKCMSRVSEGSIWVLVGTPDRYAAIYWEKVKYGTPQKLVQYFNTCTS